LDQGLRSTTKYGTSIINHGQEATTEELEVAEKMREMIRGVLEEYNLNLND
jgi:division protein CdvB (Snf7/Vps24/ESCRT-III family)